MKHGFFILLAGAALALSAQAVRAAESWNLLNQEEASFQATVVDMICELTGDCPETCGAGDRQLGLLDEDGKLILVAKNFTFFAGGTLDLQPYCGEAVEVDGYFVWAENQPRVYFLQFLRRPGEADWTRANAFAGKWAEREGFAEDGEERKKWWNNDPRVLEVIERDGVLGLGPAADEAYFEGAN
jgi:hypothetical protein